MSCYNCKYHKIMKGFLVQCVLKNESIDNPWDYCEECDLIEGVVLGRL